MAAPAAERGLSPLSGCYLLVVLSEPHHASHRPLILQRVVRGLSSWDQRQCGVDLGRELQALIDAHPEGEQFKFGERLIQFATENVVAEILVNPQVYTFQQCLKNMLSSFTRHRHLVHAGYSFSGNGSWILQDGTFSGNDLLDALREPDVQRVTRAYETSINIHIHCPEEGIWRSDALLQDPVYAASKVVMNPPDKGAVPPEVDTFIDYLAGFLGPSSLDQLLTPSDVVGNIRFSRPTLYVFPGGQGDAAMFGINGFNILFDGGFSRRACCWNFVRHLDRLDAVLMSRLNNGSLMGMSAMLQRKVDNATYPQIGHFFANMIDQKELPVGDKDGDPLLVNTQLEAQRLLINLKALALKPTPCVRDNSSDPINLYHKVGHGRLDLYVLNPQRDGVEMQTFLKSWTEGPGKSRVNVKVKGKEFPVANLVSICCLLVWVPDDRHDTVTRLLFPGSAPQQKVFEGLDRLKHLQFMKTPVCFAKALDTKNHKTSDLLLKSSQVPSATRRAERIERMEVEHKQRRVRSTSRHDRNGDRDVKKADKAKGHELLAEIKAKKQEANKERAEKVPPKSSEKVEKLDSRKESKPPATSLPKKPGTLKGDNKQSQRPREEKDDKVPRRDTEEGSTPVKVKKDVNNKMIVEEKKVPRTSSKSKQIKTASEVKTTKVVESKIEKVTGSGVISKQPEPKKGNDKAKTRVSTKSEKTAGVKPRPKPPASPKKIRGIKPKSSDVNKLDMTSTPKIRQDTDPEVSTMRGTGDIEEVTMTGDMLTVTKVTTEVQRIIEEVHEGSAVDSLEHVSGDFSRDIETDSLELRKVDEKIDSLKQSPTTEDSKDMRQSSEEQMRRTDIEEAVLMQPSQTSPERPDGFQIKMNDLPHVTAPQKKDVVKTPDEVAELPEHEALELPEHEGHQGPAKSRDETESETRSEAKLGGDNYGDRKEGEVEVTEDTEKEKDSLADDKPMSSPEKAKKEQLNARLKDSSPEEPTAPEESATESPHDSSERDAHVETGGEPSPKNSSRSRQDIICTSPRREMYPIGEPYIERGVEAETHHETVQMEKPEMVMITSSATTPSPISPTKGDRWAVDAQLLPIVDERSLEEVVSQTAASTANVDELRTDGKASKDVGMKSTGQVDTRNDWGQDNKYSVEQVGFDHGEDEQVFTISRTYMTDRSEELLVGSSEDAPSSAIHAIVHEDTMDKTSPATTKEVAKITEQQEYTERGISEPKKPVEEIKQTHTEATEHKGIVHKEYPTENEEQSPTNEFLTEQAALVLGTIPEPKKPVHEKEAMTLSPETHHAIGTSPEGRSAEPAKSPDHHEKVVTHRIEEATAQSEEIQTKMSSILSPTDSELAESHIHEALPKNDEICDTDGIKLPSSGHVGQIIRDDVSSPSDMTTEPVTEPDIQKDIQHQEPPQSGDFGKPLMSPVVGTPIGVLKDAKEAHGAAEDISEEHYKAFLAEQAELALEARDGVQQSPTVPVQTRSPPVPHEEVIECSENQRRLHIDQDDANGSMKSTSAIAAHVKEQDAVEKPVMSPALGPPIGVLKDTKEVHGKAEDISEEHHKAFLTEQAEVALETREGVQQSPMDSVQTRSPPVPHEEVIIEGPESQRPLHAGEDDANGSLKRLTSIASDVKEQDVLEEPLVSSVLDAPIGVPKDSKELHGEAKDISEEHHKAFLAEQAELVLETRDGVQQSPTVPVQARSPPVPHKEVIEGSENQRRMHIDEDDAHESPESTTPIAAHVKEQDAVDKSVMPPVLGAPSGVLKDTKEAHGAAEDISEEHHKAFLAEQAGLVLERRDEVQQSATVPEPTRSPPLPHGQDATEGSESQRRLRIDEDDVNGSAKSITPIAAHEEDPDAMVQHDVLGQRELETESRVVLPSDDTLSEVGVADSKGQISSSVLSGVSSDARKMSEEMHVMTREEAIAETILPAAANDVEKSPTKSTPTGVGGDQGEDVPSSAVDMKKVQELSTVQDEHKKATSEHISQPTLGDISSRTPVPPDASAPTGFAGEVKDSVTEKGVPVKGETQTGKELHASKVDENLRFEHVPVSDGEQHGESQSPKRAQEDRESTAAFFKEQIEIAHDERTLSKDAFMVDSDTRPSKSSDVSSDIITEKAAEAVEQYRPVTPTIVGETPGTPATSMTTPPSAADEVHALGQALPEHADTKIKLQATDFSIEKADQDLEKSQSRTAIATREQVVSGKEILPEKEQAHTHHMSKVGTEGDDAHTVETSYIAPPTFSPATFVKEPLPLTTSHIMVSTTMEPDGSGRPSGLISDATASTMHAEGTLCSTVSPLLSSIESQATSVPLVEKSVESSPSTSSRKTSYIIEEVEVISPRQRRQYEDVEEIVTYSPSRRSRTLSETSVVSNVSDMSQLRSESSILSEHIQEATESQGAAKTAITPVIVSVSSKTVSSVAAGRRISDGNLDLDDGLTSDQSSHGTCTPSSAGTQSDLAHESTGGVPLEYKMGVVEERIEISQESFGTSAVPPSRFQGTSVMPDTSAMPRNIDEDDLMSQIISGRDIAPGIVAPTCTQTEQEECKELITHDEKSPVAETVTQTLQSRVDEVAISDEHDIVKETVTSLNGRTDLGVGDSTLPHKLTASPGFDHSNLTTEYVQAEVEDLLLQTGLITVAKSASYEELAASYGKTVDSTMKSELPDVCEDKPKSSEMDLDSLLSKMQSFDTDVDLSGKTSSPGHPETGLQPSVKRRKSRDLTSTLEGLEHDIEALQSIKPDRLKDRDVCIGDDDGHDYALDVEGPITCKTVADLGPISKDSDKLSDRPLGSPGREISPLGSPMKEPILPGHRKGSPSTEIEMIKRDHDLSLDDQVVEDVLEKTAPTSKHVASYLTRATTSSPQKQTEAAEGSVPIPTLQTADGASVVMKVGDGQKTSGTPKMTSLSPTKGSESPQAAEPTLPMQRPLSTSPSKYTTQKEGEDKSTTTPATSQETDSKLKGKSEEADGRHVFTPEKDDTTEASQPVKDNSQVSGVLSKEDGAQTKADQDHEIKHPAKEEKDDVKQSSIPQKDDVDARKFYPADVSAQFLKTEDSMNGNNEPPLPESDGAVFQKLRDAGGILSAFVPGIASRFEDVVTASHTEGHTHAQSQDGVTSPPSDGATVRAGDTSVASQRQEGPATATQPDVAPSGAVAAAAPGVGGDVTSTAQSADRPDGYTEGPGRPLSPLKDVVDSATGKAQVRSEKGDRVDEAVAVVVSDVGKQVESSGASHLPALDADTQAANAQAPVDVVGAPVHPPDGILLPQTDVDSNGVALASEMSTTPYTVGWVEGPTTDKGLDFSEDTALKPTAESGLKVMDTSITMGVVQQEQSGKTDIKDTTGHTPLDFTSVDMKTDVAEISSDKPQDIEEDRSVIDFTAVGRTVTGAGGGILAKDKETVPGGQQPTELTSDTLLEQKLPSSEFTSSEERTIAPSDTTGIAGAQSSPGRTSSVPLDAVQPGTPPDISTSSTITSTLSGLTGESTDDPGLTRTEVKDRKDSDAMPPAVSTSTQQILPEGIRSDDQQLGTISRDTTDVAPSHVDVVEVTSSSKATCDVSITGEKHEQEVRNGTDTAPPSGKLDDREFAKEVVEDKASVTTEAPQLSPGEGRPHVSGTFTAAKDVAESTALSASAIPPESGTVATQKIDSEREAEQGTSKAPTLTTTTDSKSLLESQTLDSATCDPTATQSRTSEQGDVLPTVLSEGKEVGLAATPQAGHSPTGTRGTLSESTASAVDAPGRAAERKLTAVRESASRAADRMETTPLKTEPGSHDTSGARDKAATSVGDSTTSDAHKPTQDLDESVQSAGKSAVALASSAEAGASAPIRSLGDSTASEGIVAGRQLDSGIRAGGNQLDLAADRTVDLSASHVTVASELHQIAVKTAEEVVGRVTSAAKEKALDVAITDVQEVDDKTSKAGIQEHATDRKPSVTSSDNVLAKSSDNALADKKVDSHEQSVTKIAGDMLKTGAQIASAKVESTSKTLEQALGSGVQKAAESMESSTKTVADAFTRGVDNAASSAESATKSADEALKTAAQNVPIQAQTTAEGLGESLASAAKACEDQADSATKAAEKVLVCSAQSAADETKALVRAADKELTSTIQQEAMKVESMITSATNVVSAGLSEIKDAAKTGDDMLASGVQSISEQAELCTKAADEALASAVQAVDSKVADGAEESLASAHHITAAMAGSAADMADRTLSAAQRADSQVQDAAVASIADTSDRLTGATEEKFQEAERAIIQGVEKLGKLSKATDDQANKAVQGVGRVADGLAQSASETVSQMGRHSSDVTAEIARQSSHVMKDAEDVLKESADSAASSMLSVGEGLSTGLSGVESDMQTVGEQAAAGVIELSESLYRSTDACLEEADSALEDAGSSVRSALGGLFGFGRRKSSKDASPTKESPKAERKGGFFSKMFGRKSPDDPTQLEEETRPEGVPEPTQPTGQRQPVQEVVHRADIRVQLEDDDRRRSSSDLSDIREEASGSGRSSSREPSSPRGVLEAQTSATEPRTQHPTAAIDPMTSSMHESFHDVMSGSIHEALQGADGAFAMPGVEFRQPRSPPQSLSPAVQDGEDDAAVSGWGPPLGLPPPVPPPDHAGIPTPPPTKRAIMSRARVSDSPRAGRLSGPPPVYLDLVYVPHHANAFYSGVQFFHRVRARYYVFSSIEPSREVFNALLEAKQHWEDKNLEVTIIPTYDTDTLGHWFASNEQQLEELRIDLAPSASRCTINLQDHETSCAAYRLEF